jgi:ATP-dependent Clp protease ATP-binding subunit ClpX
MSNGILTDVPAGKSETFVVDTSNILFICSGAFVGLDQLVNSRLGKGVRFIF